MLCNLIVHFLTALRCSAWLWVGCSPAKKKRWLPVRLIANILFTWCTAYAPSHVAITCSPLSKISATACVPQFQTSTQPAPGTRHPAPSTHWYPVRPVVHDMPQGLAIKPKSQDSFRERKHAFDLFINMHKPQWSTKNASQVSCGREELFCYEAPPPAPLKQKQEIMEALACLRRYKDVHSSSPLIMMKRPYPAITIRFSSTSICLMLWMLSKQICYGLMDCKLCRCW